MLDALPILDLSENSRPALAHATRVALHDSQIRANRLSEVDLVDDKQVAARDAGPALARHLVAARDVDDVDDKVGQLARVVRRQVVASGLDQQQVRLELPLQRLQGQEVRADVLPDGGVRTASCLDGANALWGEGFVASEEFGVFSVGRKRWS